METTAFKTNPQDEALPVFTSWPLDQSISECAAHLAQTAAARAKDGRFTFYMPIRADHIASDLREEFLRHNPVEPQWHDRTQHLLDLVIDSVSQLASQTGANFVYVALTLGRNLPPPVSSGPFGLCGSLDCSEPQHGIFCRPALPAPILLGLTFACEPVDIGYRRLNDAQKQDENLSQEDAALYQWTLRTLKILHDIQVLAQKPAPDHIQKIKKLCDETYIYLHVICGEHILTRIARLRNAAQAGTRLVNPLTASVHGAAHVGRYEHPGLNGSHVPFEDPYRRIDADLRQGEHVAASALLNGALNQPHHPLSQSHHYAGLEPQPHDE